MRNECINKLTTHLLLRIRFCSGGGKRVSESSQSVAERMKIKDTAGNVRTVRSIFLVQ